MLQSQMGGMKKCQMIILIDSRISTSRGMRQARTWTAFTQEEKYRMAASERKKDRSMLIAIIAGLILYFWILPQVQSATKQDAQPAETTAPNDSAVQTSDQRTLQKIVTGEVDKDITGAFYSEDRSKLSVEAYIANNKNKSIYDIVVTFTVTDNAENVLAKKVINTPAELASGETGDYTTIIETPSKPTGETHVQMGTTYKIRYE